jgi:hypothetical protein
MEAWLKGHGFTTHKLIHEDATEDAIDEWFEDQTSAWVKNKRAHPKKKFLLLCFYSGHGDKNGGTNRVHLPGPINYCLEDKIR